MLHVRVGPKDKCRCRYSGFLSNINDHIHPSMLRLLSRRFLKGFLDSDFFGSYAPINAKPERRGGGGGGVGGGGGGVRAYVGKKNFGSKSRCWG